jgi:5-methyltetrahydropteroyltriglutamate--homocysteine methyltransferase
MDSEILRAEVVGSLLRPQALVDARHDARAGTLAPDAYAKIEDQSVDHAIRVQEAAGMDVVTDGEMRRDVFFDFLISGLSGLSMLPGDTVRFHSHEKEVAMEVQIPFSVTGRIRATECPGVREYRYAAAQTAKPVKVTLPSPGMMTGFWNHHSKQAYPDVFRLMEDAAQAVESWMRQLAAAGCRYIQIDAPELNEAYVDAGVRAGLARRGIDPRRYLKVGTDLIAALGSINLPGVTKALHICKGNGTQSWIAEGGYEETARGLLSKATGYDAFLMEFDDERSGSFESLQQVADDKVIVLGLVSTKWTRLETPAELKARVVEAARHHPLDRLALSTQCGFASAAETAADRRITESVQADKLKLVADVAHEVWG